MNVFPESYILSPYIPHRRLVLRALEVGNAYLRSISFSNTGNTERTPPEEMPARPCHPDIIGIHIPINAGSKATVNVLRELPTT